MRYISNSWLWIIRQVNKIGNERIRIGLLQALPFWIASLLAGGVAVGYAALFSFAEDLSISIIEHRKWMILLLAPVCFLLAALLVNVFAPYSRGSGIPQVMASIELANPPQNNKISKLLGFKIIVVKIISSVLLVFGGGAIGREGPTIQIAGSVFYLVNRWIPANWPKITKRNMIMTGAAAGLAAAFNTPLGGIVFAVEELTKTHISYFRTALFSAVIIAGLTAQAILGPYLYLGFPKVNDLSPYIFAGVLLVSISAGLAGAYFAKVMLQLLAWRQNHLKKLSHQYLWVLGCGLSIAVIAFFIHPSILGSGNEIMNPLLFSNNKQMEWYVPLLRMLGPVITFVSGGAGGVFAPSLTAGATMGAFIADYFHMSATNANMLMLAGMVGFLTGVTRTPFTAAILVLEMTDRHSIIFYLMLAAMIANMVALLVDKRSFYDHLKKQYLKDVNQSEEKKDEPLQK
ncbi:chloride channel protein [Aridibaculum aurantiacum]|uniref:chloride channel protein n=1 Tax=Aridibaculum aurantiacum TaxID=2810307 RepID=UPI001A962146|nr:chloride channel protein [Aridibaculum aurantiacum]